MDGEQVLTVVEQVLLHRSLEQIEQLILCRSWLGQTYSDMAQNSGYRSEYIKQVGSQLWYDLSKALGRKVTKKNLQLILNRYEQEQLNHPQNLSGVLPAHISTEMTYSRPSKLMVFDFPSNSVPPESPFYIHRISIEKQILTEIEQPGGTVRVKAPRKMGKTSLINQIVTKVGDKGYKTAWLDFQEADEVAFDSLDKFLRWFAANITRQLNLNLKLDQYWNESVGSKVSCRAYFEGYLLEQVSNPLLLIMDEANRIFEYPAIAQDFFLMLRLWSEQAKQIKTWHKLKFIVAYTPENNKGLHLNREPFNLGLLVSLPSFTLDQVQDLGQRYDLDWANNSTGSQRLTSLMELVGGHPYLVNIAFYHLRQGTLSLEDLLQSAPTLTSVYNEHLQNCLAMVQEDSQLASALRQVVTSEKEVQLNAIVAYKLESMGLIILQGNWAKPSCEMYRLFFRSQLQTNGTDKKE